MKKKAKFLTILGLSTLSVLCFGVACGTETDGPLGEAYDWVYNRPFAGEPDEDMTIDGILDEEVWQNKSVLSQTLSTKAWSATTHFTEKGLYVAVQATDKTMSYNTRFSSRSCFNVYVCKTGAQTYNINSLAYHESRCLQFQLDPYFCRSRERVPYYYEAHVEGELNSETTCTMTAELFLTWKDLYYEEDELGENGYPDSIQMYVNYEGESSQVLGSCLWREETFFHYGKDGFLGTIDHEDLGSVVNGLAATDMWEVNEDGKAQTTAGRTQILWLKDAYAKDFVFEAELTPLGKNSDGTEISLRGEKVSGRFGLINETAAGKYTILSADARSLTDYSAGSRQIKLQTCQEIDSFHWQNQISLSQKTVKSNYDGSSVIFRVIKQGDMFYYFYGDTYWGSERIADMADEAYCGFYTSQGMRIESYRFADYTGKSDELVEELSKYVYFVSVSGEMTRGSVSTSSYAVAKGEEVTISFLAKSKNILTSITRDGTDVFDEVVAAMNDKCEYTFKPTADVSFDAEFTAFDTASLVKSVIVFENDSGSRIMDANYELSGSNKLLFYKGTPNASGYVIVQIPKAGTYVVNGRTIEVDGIYHITSSFGDYHDTTASFTLNEDTKSVDINGKAESVKANQSFTLYVVAQEKAWGSVTVNGITVSGSGTLLYNADTGNYYADNSSVRRYYKSTVASDYAVDFTISMSEIGHNNNDLAAFAITDGNDVLVFKLNLNVGNTLIVATGNSATLTTCELAIDGFGWYQNIKQQNGDALGSGTFSFRVVKCGYVIYLFDAEGEMRAYFNKNGMTLVNGTKIIWGESSLSAVNEDIGKLFATGEETAIGVFTYRTINLRAEFDLDFSTAPEDIYTEEIAFGAFSVALPAGCTLSEAYPVQNGYGIGEVVQIGVNVANAQTAKLKIAVTDGNGTRLVEGIYDWTNKCIVFTFEYGGGISDAKIVLIGEGGMIWSDDWGEFIPDRENTLVE